MKSNKELDLNFIDKLQDELADMSVGGIYSLYSITLSDGAMQLGSRRRLPSSPHATFFAPLPPPHMLAGPDQ